MASPLLSSDVIKEHILWRNLFETGEYTLLGTLAIYVCGCDIAVYQTIVQSCLA